ncbi:MAG: hypothetical protein LBF85_09865 [Tannerella sp.]|jgi:hypothetical protein|nr:hypothetical protein [Tannerella sp.]
MSAIKAIARLNEFTKDTTDDYYLRPDILDTLDGTASVYVPAGQLSRRTCNDKPDWIRCINRKSKNRCITLKQNAYGRNRNL